MEDGLGINDGPPETPAIERAANDDGHRIALAAENELPRSRAGLDRHGPVDLPELRDYVRGVVERLLEASPAFATREREIDVFITSRLAPLAANATPAGDILVSVGTFRQADGAESDANSVLESEDALAFILAHEIAHIARDHFATDSGLRNQMRVTSTLRRISRFVTNLTESRSIDLSEDVRATALKLRTALRALEFTSQGILSPSWRRSSESEADRFAIDMMIRAGYKYRSAFSLVKGMHERQAQQQDAVREKYRQIFDLFAKLQKMQTDNKLEGQLAAWGIRGAGRMTENLMNIFADKYESPEERAEDVRTYVKVYNQQKYVSQYGPYAGVPNVQGYKSGVPARAHQVTQDYLQPAKDAERMLAQIFEAKATDDPNRPDYQDLLEEAERLGKAAISGWGGDQAYPRLVMHDVRKEQGDRKTALLNLKYGIRDGALAVDLYKELAVALAESGNRSDALKILSQLESRLGDSEFYDIRGEILIAANSLTEAEGTLNTCVARAESYAVQQDCDMMLTRLQDRSRTSNPRSDGSQAGSEGSGGFMDTLGDSLDELGM